MPLSYHCYMTPAGAAQIRMAKAAAAPAAAIREESLVWPRTAAPVVAAAEAADEAEEAMEEAEDAAVAEAPEPPAPVAVVVVSVLVLVAVGVSEPLRVV